MPVFKQTLGKWLGYEDSNLGMTESEPVVLPLDDTPVGKEGWLGYEDSNLGMTESKSVVLPLDDTPSSAQSPTVRGDLCQVRGCARSLPAGFDSSGTFVVPQNKDGKCRITASGREVMPEQNVAQTSSTWPQSIKHELVPASQRKQPPKSGDDVAFGTVQTTHMLTADFTPESGWQEPQIRPYAPLTFSPDSLVFHYGQQIFEGLKAYRRGDGGISLFRPDMNARRFYRSAQRLAMAPVPEDMFLACVKELVKVESEWVLPQPWSLYIRPFLIPTDRGVSLRASRNYRFVVIASPVSAYYSSPYGVAVMVERQLVRAAPGGVGEAKCGGNYAASLLPLARARAVGAEQVLWLDAHEHRYVEEVGAMNIMFVYGKHIVTPKLVGSILPGVTRDSVIRLAPELGYTIEESRISLDQVFADLAAGRLTECFGCGTAAVISPVQRLIDGDHHYDMPKPTAAGVANTLNETLRGIQSGAAPDPWGWRHNIA
jgi:branched-chain amino acid aminotransferase